VITKVGISLYVCDWDWGDTGCEKSIYFAGRSISSDHDEAALTASRLFSQSTELFPSPSESRKRPYRHTSATRYTMARDSTLDYSHVLQMIVKVSKLGQRASLVRPDRI
jgi:hypothetical protein